MSNGTANLCYGKPKNHEHHIQRVIIPTRRKRCVPYKTNMLLKTGLISTFRIPTAPTFCQAFLRTTVPLWWCHTVCFRAQIVPQSVYVQEKPRTTHHILFRCLNLSYDALPLRKRGGAIARATRLPMPTSSSTVVPCSI